MRNGNIILALDPTIKVVRLMYAESGSNPIYAKTELDLEVDDIVVVSTGTRVNYTCCKVIDADVDFDVESHDELVWVVGFVDIPAHNARLARESRIVKAVTTANRQRQRDKLREQLTAGVDAEMLEQLKLSSE